MADEFVNQTPVIPTVALDNLLLIIDTHTPYAATGDSFTSSQVTVGTLLRAAATLYDPLGAAAAAQAAAQAYFTAGTNITIVGGVISASGGSGSGTVTMVSVVTANGVSGSVANATTTPAITLTLGAITPTSVNGNTITTGTGTLTLSTYTLTVAGTASVSGTNTGDQTVFDGGSA